MNKKLNTNVELLTFIPEEKTSKVYIFTYLLNNVSILILRYFVNFIDIVSKSKVISEHH